MIHEDGKEFTFIEPEVPGGRRISLIMSTPMTQTRHNIVSLEARHPAAWVASAKFPNCLDGFVTEQDKVSPL